MPRPGLRHALAIIGALVVLATACTSGGARESTALEPVDGGPRATLAPVPTAQIDADFCADNQRLAACERLLDDLSDAEFCELLPEDLFCERFFDPDAESRSEAADASATPAGPAVQLDEAEPDGQADGQEVDDGNVDDGENSETGLIPIEGDGSVRILPPTDVNETVILEGVDPLRRREDGMCLPDDRLAVEGDVDYDVAYQVIDGQLGYVCHGIPDAKIEAAWATVVEMTPPDYLTELAIFAGFFDNSASNRNAFVRPVGPITDSEFLMATNVIRLDNDEYTVFAMAHEMGHVLALRSNQLDPSVPPATCETFHSSTGCHVEGSILDRWITEFWSGERPTDPEDRCDEDPGLLTSYAATSPHEDFAESFAAAVVGFRPENRGHDARLAFMAADPELAQFIERGDAAGYTSPRFVLGVCG